MSVLRLDGGGVTLQANDPSPQLSQKLWRTFRLCSPEVLFSQVDLRYFPYSSSMGALIQGDNVVEVTAGSCVGGGGGGGIFLSRLSGDSRAHLAPGSPSGRTLLPAAAAWSAARGLEVTVTLSPSLFLTPPPRRLAAHSTHTVPLEP